LNIRLIHLKRIGKRLKEEIQNEQGRNGNLAEGNRTGDDRPGQTQTGGRIQENIETHLNGKEGEHLMELMTIKQLATRFGRKYCSVFEWAKNRNIKPVKIERVPGVARLVQFYDPAPFFEFYVGREKPAEKLPYEKPTIEEVAQGESVEEYPSMAPPLPVLTPERIYALNEVFGSTGAINVLRNNYGLNDITAS